MIWQYALPNILRVRTELQKVRRDAPGTDIDKLANETDVSTQQQTILTLISLQLHCQLPLNSVCFLHKSLQDKSDHVTSLLKTFQWSPLSLRVKVQVHISHKALTCPPLTPSATSSLLVCYTPATHKTRKSKLFLILSISLSL